MAIRSTANTLQPQQQPKGLVTCMTCKHAHLIRYGTNPVLAECRKKPQPDNRRFPFEREVASPLRKCTTYAYDVEVKDIEQMVA